MRHIVIALFIDAFFSHPRCRWRELLESEARSMSTAVALDGDRHLYQGTPMSRWRNWVVLRNDNVDRVLLVFRATSGSSEVCQETIESGETFAARIGPEQVSFFFIKAPKSEDAMVPDPPVLVDKLSGEQLSVRYPAIRRM